MRSWILAIAFAIAFAAQPGYAAAQGCEPPATGDWLITENIVCSSQTIVLNGSLLINGVSNLTLENSILSFNSNYNGQFGIDVNGTLSIAGSTIRSESSYAYTFVSNTGATLSIRDSSVSGCGFISGDNKMRGVYVKSSGTVISNVTFANNYYALLLYASGSNVSASTFASNYVGIEVSGSNDIITGNTLVSNSGGNIAGMTGSGITLSSNVIANSSSTAFPAFLINNSVISSNIFFNNSGGGFGIAGVGNNLTGNRIEANKGSYGLELANSANSIVTGNVILGNTGYGLYIDTTSNTLLANNLVNASGIYDLWMRSAVSTTITNTTYTYGIRKWQLSVRAIDNASSFINAAQVVVMSNLSGIVFSGNTNAQGYITSQVLNEKIENASGTFLFNPYFVNVSKTGYASNYTAFNLTSDSSLALALTPIPTNESNASAFIISIASPKNETYMKYNLTVNLTLALSVYSDSDMNSCNYTIGSMSGQMQAVGSTMFTMYINVSDMEGGEEVVFICVSSANVTNTTSVSFTVYPAYECVWPADCNDEQTCLAWECQDLECNCGYASDHQCVYYDCCSDSVCSGTQVCDLATHACKAVSCACPEKISSHKCDMDIGYCCSDLQCDENETCSSANECVERMLSMALPSSFEVGQKFALKVVDQNYEPVDGVRILVKYLDTDPLVEDDYETDSSGTAAIEIKHAGRVDFTARKGGYFLDISSVNVPEPFDFILLLEIIVLIASCGGIAFAALRIMKSRKAAASPGGVTMKSGGEKRFSLSLGGGPLKLEKTVSGPRVMLKVRNKTNKTLEDIIVRDSVPRGAFIRCNVKPKIEPFDESTETLTWEILELAPMEEVIIEYDTKTASKGFAVKFNGKEYVG
ncbi:MAG: right-handed parallel beta-helix repeat-containing protein [Candidatus Aenigmarchaeota archaeon]|nr:right-handed parallel beta-helix repeat-containing protein [Candidatus Aenigmarchaeota archaeon]